MAAAGIGEATAIIAVAQLGISLSNALISYIGEVQDAPFRIQCISNEVATTSERLREIGELVGKNQQTHIISEEGINSAVRCSEECQKIIEDLKAVLQKGGRQQKSTAFESDFIDTSLFSTFRWPFLKKSLEVPRAELQRIKIDLLLIFSAAMALGAATSSDKAKYIQDIPGLRRSRDWAASMADQVRQRARHPYIGLPQREKPGDAFWADNEPEMLEDFVAYQERRIREEEEKKIKARALLLQAEEEEKKDKEEEAKRAIELKAVEAYKKQQDELQNQSAEQREVFRNELLSLGLEADQIEHVLSSPKFNFGGSGVGANMPTVRPKTPSIDSGDRKSITPSSSRVDSDLIIRRKGSSTRQDWVRRILPWRRRRPLIYDEERRREPSLDFLFSDGSNHRNSSIVIETWLLDFSSNMRTEFMPSAEWLEKIAKKQNRESNLWRCFAGLNFLWRNSILEFLKWKNSDDDVEWSLYYIELPQHNYRMTVSGHKHDNQLLQVIIFRREDPPEKILKTVSSESYTSERPQPKVSFAEGILKKQNTKPTVIDSHEPLRFRNKNQIMEAIKRLGAKKEKLDGAEPERIDEINDMIVLLATQLQLHDTLSPSQRDILYSDSQYDEYAGTNAESGAATRPIRSKRMEGRSHVTDRTEEFIYNPRDGRNRPLEEYESWNHPEARPKEPAYSYIENPVVKTTSTPQMPVSSGRGHDYGSPAGAERLVIPGALFERDRPRGTPAYRNSSPDGEAVGIRRQDGERYRDVGEISYEIPAQRERYLSPSRGQEIVIRRDDQKMPEYEREVIIIPEREREEVIIRRRERSPSEYRAISRKPYRYSPPQRPRQLSERLTEQQKELEKLKLKEEILRLKEERARSRHDYTTADDLAYYAIPDILTDIRRLEPDYEVFEESRHPYIPRSTPIRRTSTFDDDTWPNAASKALVLRTGGSRQPDDYLREHIFDRSIRIRGDTDDSILPVKNAIIERHRTSADSRRSSYSERERDRRHESRRPTLESEVVFEERSSRAHGGYSNGRPRHRDVERVKNRPWRSRPAFSSSEDDDYMPIRMRAASKQQSGPSNEELITQTLKRFTTFQGDQPPSAAQTSPADTSSRQPIPAANGDISTGQEFQSTKLPLSTASQTLSVTALGHSQAEPSAPLGFGTMSEEPGTLAEGTSPQSPTQASSYPRIDGPSPQTDALPPPPGAGLNRQPKATKELRITEVSDESSEDGRRRLRKEDRKATVEDFEPDLEAGQIDSGTKIYE